MNNLGSIEELARALCRDVYEATNGQPREWLNIGSGGAAMRRATIYAIARGWLIADGSRGVRVSCSPSGPVGRIELIS